MSSVTGHAQGSEPCQSSASSAPSNTATTPSAARAASVDTRVMCACAYGLRTTAMWTVPGGAMLSTHVARPLSRDASSLRLTDVPTNVVVLDSVTVI